MSVKIETEDYIGEVKSDQEVRQEDGLVALWHTFEQHLEKPTAFKENVQTYKVSFAEVFSGA